MPDEYISREEARKAIFVRVGMRTIGTRLQAAYEEAIDAIDNLPAADVAPVVRCKDCIYNIDGLCFCRRPLGSGVAVEPDDFCRWGEAE